MIQRLTVLLIFLVLLTAFGPREIFGQGSTFVYQGRLADSGTPVSGNYDLQFALWNSLSGGSQVGSTQTINTVAVSNGVFTVNLDFSAGAFPGASRFLEIAVRPAGVGSFTTLTPRQPITSTPYAVRSLNAATADSVTASGVPSGSGNYIQNSTSPQSSSNFNITGNGTAAGSLSGNIVSATTQYNLNGQRILIIPGGTLSGNIFAGISANNSLTGTDNTGFGFVTGSAVTTGSRNSLFGSRAGDRITTGSDNAAFGDSTGESLVTTSFNTFLGAMAGQVATGNLNTFVGANADFFSLTQSATNGSLNTLLGANASVRAPLSSLDNATAIGANAEVDQSNSLVLGSINGVNLATADTNVGIGTTTPARLLHLKGPGSNGLGNGDLLITGTGTVGSALTFESTGSGGRKFSWISTANSADAGGGKLAVFDVTSGAYRMVIDGAGNVGIGTTAPTANLSVNGSANKPGGGSWGTFSDERLKNIKGSFSSGLQALMRLQPLRYQYKPDNALKLKSDGEHIGFSAQAVQQVIPEAVSQTNSGYLVVNNDPIIWTMLNAIKEQQIQIKAQQKQIAELTNSVVRLQRRRTKHR